MTAVRSADHCPRCGAVLNDDQCCESCAWAGEPPPVRCPRLFFDDHWERGLPTPEPVRETKRHVWLDPDDEHLAELVSDARYYSQPDGFDADTARRICPAARALLRALEAGR